MIQKSILAIFFALFAVVSVCLASSDMEKRGAPVDLPAGFYKITNVLTRTTARDPGPDRRVVYVSDADIEPIYEVWRLDTVKTDDDSVGTYFLSPARTGQRTNAANFENALVEVGDRAKIWLIKQANNAKAGQLVIVDDDDHSLIWSVARPQDKGFSEVRLQQGGAGDQQVWTFERLDDV